MDKKALYSLTHDADGNAFYWIIGTPQKRPRAKKPDFTVWFRGYDLAGLKKTWDYLKKCTAPEEFLIMDCYGRGMNLKQCMEILEARGKI